MDNATKIKSEVVKDFNSISSQLHKILMDNDTPLSIAKKIQNIRSKIVFLEKKYQSSNKSNITEEQL